MDVYIMASEHSCGQASAGDGGGKLLGFCGLLRP